MLRRFFVAASAAVLSYCVAGGYVLTAVGFLDGRAFPGEFFSLFRLQYFAVAVLIAGIAAIAKRRVIAFAALALAIVNAVGVLPALVVGARPDPERPRLKILTANVRSSNVDHGRLLRLIEVERPDVIGVLELTPRWAAALKTILPRYPYHVTAFRGYGIGLYARKRPADMRIVFPVPGWPAFAYARIDLEGKELPLFVIHAPSTTRPRTGTQHRSFMRGLGDAARGAGAAALICGDFNAAPWTGPFQDLRDRGNLEPADPLRPFAGTFPVRSTLLRVPIDQCLAGKALAVATRRGPDIGSDHLPLIVDVARLPQR